MNKPKPVTGAERQAKYVARLKEQGLIRVVVVVPEKEKERLQTFAAKLRGES